jgi:hypothetical protein
MTRKTRIGVVIATVVLCVISRAASQPAPLGSADIRVVGAALKVTAPTDLPLHTRIELPTRIESGGPSIRSDELLGTGGLFQGAPVYVRGRLTGQGIGTTGEGSSARGAIELDPAPPGQLRILPRLTQDWPVSRQWHHRLRTTWSSSGW